MASMIFTFVNTNINCFPIGDDLGKGVAVKAFAASMLSSLDDYKKSTFWRKAWKPDCLLAFDKDTVIKYWIKYVLTKHSATDNT